MVHELQVKEALDRLDSLEKKITILEKQILTLRDYTSDYFDKIEKKSHLRGALG